MNAKAKNVLIFIGVISGVITGLCIIGAVLYTWLFKDTTFDIATLISVVLALFSIIISAMFYFKATDTSNRFYDNTYKYMKEQAESLGRIDAKFGEKFNTLEKLITIGSGFEETTESIDSVLKESLDVFTKKKGELEQELNNVKIINEIEQEKLIADLNEKEQTINELMSKNRNNSRSVQEVLSQIKRYTTSNQAGSDNYNIKSYGARRVYDMLCNMLIERDIKIDNDLDNLYIKHKNNLFWDSDFDAKGQFYKEIKDWLNSRPQLPKKKDINYILRKLQEYMG